MDYHGKIRAKLNGLGPAGPRRRQLLDEFLKTSEHEGLAKAATVLCQLPIDLEDRFTKRLAELTDLF